MSKKYNAEQKARVLRSYRDFHSQLSLSEAARFFGLPKTTLHRWIKEAEATAPVISKSETAAPYTPDAEAEALVERIHIESNRVHELTKRLNELEERVQATAQYVHATAKNVEEMDARLSDIEHRLALEGDARTRILERVQYLEHDAQEAHEAAYKVRERLDALEASDTEPTPFHAVDRTYALVIAIMVITVAITLVTVLL